MPDPFALSLREITLRGVGPYLDGARLPIRPVTILAGKNGSGKSTWLTALRMLAESKRSLPFDFARKSDDFGFYYHTNAFVGRFAADRSPRDKAQDAEFGPPGAIGLTWRVERGMELGEPARRPRGVSPSELSEFVYEGRLRKGQELTVRLAHPYKWTNNPTDADNFDRTIQFFIDGQECVHLTRRAQWNSLSALKVWDPETRPKCWRTRIRNPYIAWLDPILLSRVPGDLILNPKDALQKHYLGWIAYLTPGMPEGLSPAACVWPDENGDHRVSAVKSTDDEPRSNRQSVRLAVKRIRQLMTYGLDGFFSIGAIRYGAERSDSWRATPTSAVTNGKDRPTQLGPRHVGYDGRQTLGLIKSFGGVPYVQAGTCPAGHLSAAFRSAEFCEDGSATVSYYLHKPDWLAFGDAAGRLWARAAKELRDRAAEAERELGKAQDDHDQRELARGRLMVAEADVLNDLLTRDDLASTWSPPEPDSCESATDESTVGHRTLAYANRRLLEQAFSKADGKSVLPPMPPYTFEYYVSYWIDVLVDTDIRWTAAAPAASRLWEAANDPPIGFLSSFDAPDEDPVASRRSVELRHDCFGLRHGGPKRGTELPVTADRLSSGFSQVAPIIVQTGLMRCGEVVAVENPEVHLHPGLQLTVMEFLLRHARAGRTILIETHSDLLIRRLLRAVLQEEVTQAMVSVAFTQLVDGKEGYRFARIEQVKVDERGRVSNWPPGFLDDDVKESRRLLDIVYGAAQGSSSDEEEDN